jgi:hypothetical protein
MIPDELMNDIMHCGLSIVTFLVGWGLPTPWRVMKAAMKAAAEEKAKDK